MNHAARFFDTFGPALLVAGGIVVVVLVLVLLVQLTSRS